MTQRARARNGRRGWPGRGFPPFSAYSGSQSRVYVGQRLSNCQGSTPLFFSTDNNSLASPPLPSLLLLVPFPPFPRFDAGPGDKKIMDRHGSCVTWKRNEAFLILTSLGDAAAKKPAVLWPFGKGRPSGGRRLEVIRLVELE